MENKKPIIIHIVNSNIYSGLEKVAIEIIEELKDKFDFYYACKDGPIVDILKEKNIKRIKIQKISKKEVLRIEKEYKPDIIHSHDYTATLFCGLFIKDTDIVAHLHNNPIWIKNYIHPYVYAFFKACHNKKIKNILTVSNSIEKEYVFSKYIKDKIQMIGNPVSIDNVVKNIDVTTKKEYDICFTGRLTKQKNPLRFIKIINNLKKDFPDIKVVMIGDGELKQKCKNIINKLELNNNIELLGFIKNPYIEMAKSKVFCLTSEWEGYGLVAFEALALGIPCVVSNTGGLVDIVDDNCGKLCKTDIDFIKHIQILLKNKEVYEKYSINAKNKAMQLENVKEYYNKIQDMYYKFSNKK